MAQAAVKKRVDADPYNIHPRLEKLIGDLLTEYEKDHKMFTTQDKLRVVQYVGMYLTRRAALIKGTDEPAPTGSAVRKYSGAFQTKTANAGGGRKASARPKPKLVHDADDGDDDFDSDDDSAA